MQAVTKLIKGSLSMEQSLGQSSGNSVDDNWLDKQQTEPGSSWQSVGEALRDDLVFQFIVKRKKDFFEGLILLFILLCAFCFRSNTFWLPHWIGDQCHHLSLAAKLDKFGFKGYNLRGVDIGFINVGGSSKVRIVYPQISSDPSSKGQVLEGLDMVGIHYYDQPLFHKPPAFPYALILSRDIFKGKGQPFTAVLTNLGDYIWKMRPRVFFLAQFYAVIVPLLFSLATIVCVYFLGKLLFSGRIGLYAASLMAIHPVSIMTAQKLWTDDMTSFFMNLGFLFMVLALKRKNCRWMLLAGLSCGVGVLAKQTAGFLLFAVIMYFAITAGNWLFPLCWYILLMPLIFRSPFWMHWVFIAFIFIRFKKAGKFKFTFRALFSSLFERYIWLFGFGFAIAAGWWFWAVYKTFGDPLFIPGQVDIAQTDITGWVRELNKRPPALIIFTIGLSYLCPLFFLAFISFRDFLRELWRALAVKAYDNRFILLWLVVITVFFNLRTNKEDRYVLLAYPALAVLAGYYIDRFRVYAGYFSKFLGPASIREGIIVALIIACAFWSVPVGLMTGTKEIILLKVPF